MTLIRFNTPEDRDKAKLLHEIAGVRLDLRGADMMESHNCYDIRILDDNNIGYFIKMHCR